MTLVSAAPASVATSAFCEPKRPVRDFGLSKLPAVREVPESAKGLGYGAVTMYGGWTRVMSEPSSFGYGFSEHNDSGSVLLNWAVTARLWIVDKRGKALREVDRDELFIRRLDARNQPHVEVDPPKDRRGFYRFDMQIANKGGKSLGSYSAYFKVVRPSWKPRLELTRDVLRSGQWLLIRVANYGSETALYGEEFHVQRFENGAWATVPDLTQDWWALWLGYLNPGGIGACNSLWIPPDLLPGRYRIVKQVGTTSWPDGKKAWIAAPFVVVPAGAEIGVFS